MKIHQNFVTLILAALFGALILISSLVWGADDLWQRAGFASALYLMGKDVLAGAAIAKSPRSLTNPNRWIQAYYLTLYFGIFMLLFTWQGLAYSLQILPRIALGSALFGGLMSFSLASKDHPYAHHFNTKTGTKAFSTIYSVWPLVSVGSFYAIIFMGVAGSLTLELMFFTSITIGFLLPRYPRISGSSWLWANLPRLAGVALLILLLFTSFM